MLEARIILRRRPDFRVKVTMIDPQKGGREIDTGLTAGPTWKEIDAVVIPLRQQLERAGNHVTVVGP